MRTHKLLHITNESSQWIICRHIMAVRVRVPSEMLYILYRRNCILGHFKPYLENKLIFGRVYQTKKCNPFKVMQTLYSKIRLTKIENRAFCI